jgi:hypothetical protein
MLGTRSVGITLLFWLAGALYTVAGTHLNIEFGLNTPRYNFEGVEQGIPRSGGTLNYVCSHPVPGSNLAFANRAPASICLCVACVSSQIQDCPPHNLRLRYGLHSFG